MASPMAKMRLRLGSKTAVIADKQAGGQHFHIISHGIMNLSQKQQILHILRPQGKDRLFSARLKTNKQHQLPYPLPELPSCVLS